MNFITPWSICWRPDVVFGGRKTSKVWNIRTRWTVVLSNVLLNKFINMPLCNNFSNSGDVIHVLGLFSYSKEGSFLKHRDCLALPITSLIFFWLSHAFRWKVIPSWMVRNCYTSYEAGRRHPKLWSYIFDYSIHSTIRVNKIPQLS